MAEEYKISHYLGANGDGIPEYNYEKFYANSDKEAIEIFQKGKRYYKYFSGFLTNEKGRVIDRIKSEKYA